MSKKKRKKARRMMEAMYARNMRAMMGNGQGAMGGLSSLLPAGRTEQFLVGAVIGAAAAYVLGDDALRAKLMKSGVKLYSSLMGDLAEMKEQMADMQAEVESERQGPA